MIFILILMNLLLNYKPDFIQTELRRFLRKWLDDDI
jgi:hypothetical protein